MSSESKELKIDDLEQYDATENLLFILKQLDIKPAESALKDLRYDLRGDFYCGECDVPLDDCFGHPNYDAPDYYADYDEDRDDGSSDKPVEGEKV